MQKTSKTLFRNIFLLVFFLSIVSVLNAAYIVSSLDFQISGSATKAKIGDDITFHMVALNNSTTYSGFSVISVDTNYVWIYSPNQPVVAPAGPYYISDGQHTWQSSATYTNVNGYDAIQLTDAMLVAGSDTVSDYNTLEFASFSVYDASLEGGGTTSIDIGNYITGISLSELTPGIYTGIFKVSENYQFSIISASLTGKFTKGGTTVSRTRSGVLSIDGIRPRVELANSTPYPYNPNKSMFQIFYWLSENCDTNLTIYNSSNVTITTRSISSVSGYNQPILWDGKSITGSAQTDGDFSYVFEIADSAGNTGVKYVGEMKLTTVELTASITTIDTQYIHTGEDQVVVNYNIEINLKNATAANLANLGFDPLVYGANDYRLYPWVMTDVKLYNGNGVLQEDYSIDSYNLTDSDPIYIEATHNPPGYQITGNYNSANTLPIPACGTNSLTVYTSGDGNISNDWDCVFLDGYLTDNGGGNYSITKNGDIIRTSISPGVYVLSVQGVLVGKSIVLYSDDVATGTDECIIPDQSYFYYPYHAQPSFFRDATTNHISDQRGFGLNSLDPFGNPDTASFIVEEYQTVPTADTDAPRVIANSEYPSNGDVIQPGVITTNNPVRITLTDDGVGPGPTNKSIFVLLDPYGNQVPGIVGWNAGTSGTSNWTVSYQPSSDLTLGGLYTFMITPIDAANNQGSTETYSFTVADTSIPVVTDVSVYPSTSNPPVILSATSSTQVPFLASRIEVTLLSGGSVAVDWTSTIVSLEDNTGNIISGTQTHTSGTNIISFTPGTPITPGSYTVNITAVSENDYQGAYSYDFYVQTANTTYIDSSGAVSVPGATTYMIVTIANLLNTGIEDSDSPPNVNMAASLISVSEITSPASNSGYNVLGPVPRFSLASGYVLPLAFATTNTVSLRMHYTNADVTLLTTLGLAESDLTLWSWDGSTWTHLTSGITGPYTDGAGDHYFEYNPIHGIPVNNAYALMYAPPAVTTSTTSFKFSSTKGFNPSKGPAKIYYSEDATQLENVKVYIYSISGTLVRKSEAKNAADTSIFLGVDINPVNPLDVRYYYSWDGKNDSGSYVRNGMYIMKIETEKTDGTKTRSSRMIAVVK